MFPPGRNIKTSGFLAVLFVRFGYFQYFNIRRALFRNRQVFFMVPDRSISRDKTHVTYPASASALPSRLTRRWSKCQFAKKCGIAVGSLLSHWCAYPLSRFFIRPPLPFLPCAWLHFISSPYPQPRRHCNGEHRRCNRPR